MKILFLFLLLTTFSFGQTAFGTIKGTVFEDNGDPALFVKILVVASNDPNRTLIGGCQSDFDGRFQMNAINPGEYDLTFCGFEYDTLTVKGVRVDLERITFLDEIKMHRIEQFEYDYYGVPMENRRTFEDPFGRSTIIDPEDIRRH